jgi:hypothetical protein
LSTHFCSSLEYLAPVNCRLLAQKLICWPGNRARYYVSAVVEFGMNSESATTMLLHILRLVLNRNWSYQIEWNCYFIMDRLVYLLKQVTANRTSFHSNLNSRVGWNVLCVYNTRSSNPTKSKYFFRVLTWIFILTLVGVRFKSEGTFYRYHI